jgi:hypothetical protein
MLKKGAMFGLDARIALAIFGALSVISGAALYSAIQQSKMVALITTLEEFQKAYDAYWLDTGVEVPAGTTDIIRVEMQELVDNTQNIKGWKGPYISKEKDPARSYALLEGDKFISIYLRSINDTWGGVQGNVGGPLPTTCTGSEVPCGRWITYGIIDQSLAHAIDEYVDGSLSYQTGKVRIYQNAAGSYIVYYLSGSTRYGS